MKNLFRKLEFKSHVFIHSDEQNLAEKLSQRLITYLASNVINENPRKILIITNNPNIKDQIFNIGNGYGIENNLRFIYLQNFLVDKESSKKAQSKIDIVALLKYTKYMDIDCVYYNHYDISVWDIARIEKMFKHYNIKSVVTIDDGYSLNDIGKEDVIISNEENVSSFMVHYLNGRKELEARMLSEGELI